MDKKILESLRFPIGRFKVPENISQEDLSGWINDIEQLPTQIRAAVAGLNDEQLDTPYRPDGWTLRQVVHHVADSHMNSYIRFKWTLTENSPTIKAYDEKTWAELPEAKTAPVELSLDLLSSLHARWVVMLKSMTSEDFKKYYTHPENNWQPNLEVMAALYAWHGKHHIGHIKGLREKMNW